MEWETPTITEKAPTSFLDALRQRLRATTQLVLHELEKSQEGQQRRYDTRVRPSSFIVGQKVLLLLPSFSNKLLVQWQSPYKIVEKVGEVDYCIRVPGQGVKLYHVNLLKAWQDADEAGWYQAERDWDKDGRERSQELQRQVAMGLPASDWQLRQIQQVLGEYFDVFQDVPGHVWGGGGCVCTGSLWPQ